MSKVFQYSGWVVAVILFIYSAVLTNHVVKIQKLLQFSENTSASVNSSTDSDAVRLALEGELADTKAALAKAEKRLAEEAERDSTVAMTETPEPEKAPDGPEEAEQEQTGELSQQERIAQAQIGAVVDMTYGDLVAELALTPEQRDLLKGAIGKSLLQQQTLMMEAFKAKDRTAKAVRADRDAMRGTLREGLKEVLSPEELAAYDDYAPVADQILYEKMVEGQLNMMASGLNEENRILASQIVAEELVREFDLYDQTEEIYSMTNFNAAQTRALNTSLERLGSTLAEDQLALVDGFVAQAVAIFESMDD